ncbi:MAG: PQQ-binding-like beta-propeller repeat protein, partial [Planctomycetota bacterium]|nr:PQQ-binding-like beta-propeller repeat protein [Planctomycetota bacterium]
MRHQLTFFLSMVLLAGSATANDWPNWRGPEQNGISRETGIVSTFDFENLKNVRWVAETGGRSTPIVLNGKVYLNCRTSENTGIDQELVNIQEQVICWDAKTGKELWRDRFNVFGTDIPVERVGWAHMTGDPETGYVYVHSVSGILRCYSGEGKLIWEISLWEEYGKISGYGGRTQTPVIDEDRLIVSSLIVSWGDLKGPSPKHYYYAFDKRTGALRWMKAPGGKPRDTNYSVPIVSVVDGTRMLIGGNSDGGVYAMNARTGDKIWGHMMSKRGLNATPAVADGKVFISHGEDNIDTNKFGSGQCLDAKTGALVWRVDEVKAGYTALLYKDGLLFVVADTGDMHAYEATSGKELWKYNLGTVGKGSPIWVDGKIIATEVDGNIHICEPSKAGCKQLCRVQLKASSGKGFDEIYGSPAISNGNVYIASRDRLICFGGDEAKSNAVEKPSAEKPVSDQIAQLQLWPAETRIYEGQSVDYQVAA